MMKGFVQGADRQQTTLLPECLDDWVDESNPVRAVDVFVDALELRDLGFDGVDPAATGRRDNLDVVADRGYFKGEEILACEQAGVAVTLPKPQTSGAKSAGRFGKPDFVCLAKDDVYRCPAGEKLEHHFTADEDGQKMRI
jgi:hypothetical protein